MRKNDSKKTYNNILSISAELFIEKGYDNTSIQDIIKKLEMSKGAVYHHFKSKEEILNAVIQRQIDSSKKILNTWIEEKKDNTAKEKLSYILEKNIISPEFHYLDNLMFSKCLDPQFIVKCMQDYIIESAPIFSKIIKEGIYDGSLNTDFPDEISEVFFILINIWCDPILFKANDEKIIKRIKFIQQMMKSMGVDIISDELMNNITNLVFELRKNESKFIDSKFKEKTKYGKL